MKKTYTKLKKPNNQVIVSKEEDKFLIGRRFAKSIAIISPFKKINDDNKFISDFRTPVNRTKRIQILYDMIPNLSEYTVNSEGISFDCISSLSDNTDIFKDTNLTNGVIHFDVTSSKEVSEDESELRTVVEVNPRLIFNEIPDQHDVEMVLDNLTYKFKTSKFKVFTVILERGFILCTVDQDSTKLYLTINNPTQQYIGNCVRKEISNISSNIAPLWPIFNINADVNKLKVYVKEAITDQYKHIDKPILLKLERQIEHPETAISCIGVSLY